MSATPPPPGPAPTSSAEAPKPAPAPAAPAPAPAPAAAKPAVAAPPAAAPKPAAPAPAPVAAPAAAPPNQLTLQISLKAVGILVSVLTTLVVLFGGLNLYLLVRLGKQNPTSLVVKQIPGMDGNLSQIESPVAAKKAGAAPTPDGAAPPKEGDAPPAADSSEVVKIGETFQAFDGKPSSLPGIWPSFRGPKIDNMGPEEVKLTDRWPSAGPKVFWSLDLGEGYAGAAVLNGRVYLLDYDEKTKEDALRCFSLDDGKEIWRRSYKVKVLRNHGMSRTVPAVTDKYVVSIGPRCHVMCVDAVTGDFKWGIDLVKEYGTTVPLWYTAQCPLIDGTTAVIAPGGPGGLIIGVDCETGKVLWKTENPLKWRMSHSSVVPMTFAGKKMYVYCAIGGIFAVSASGDDVGKILWESLEWSGIQVISPAPLVLDDGYVFLTTGYGAGSYLLRVTEEGGKFSAKTIWKTAVKDGLACEQQTPIYYKKHIFSVNPADSGARKDQLVCMNPYDNGKVVWTSGKEKRYGHYEPFMLADDKLFVLSEQGGLSIVKASTQRFEPVSEAKVLHGKDAWAPIALAGTRMILRDAHKLICIDVGREAQ